MASMPDPAHREEVRPSYAPTIRLALSLKGQAIQQYAFEKDEITVGRDPSSDVWVDNPGVSRLHLKIARAETGEFRVVDQGSANGTWLNDHPVQVATLRDGDAIHFAKYSLEVRIDELVGGRSTMRSSEQRAADGATVMLKPSEVRQLVSDPKGGRAPEAPGPRIVEFPAGRAPAAAPVPGDSGLPAWAVWAGVVVAAGAAVALWFVMR